MTRKPAGVDELKGLLMDHLSAREHNVPESASLAAVVQIVLDVYGRR